MPHDACLPQQQRNRVQAPPEQHLHPPGGTQKGKKKHYPLVCAQGFAFPEILQAMVNNRLTTVRAVSRSTSPPWGSIRFRLALRTYAPWGVRVVSQTKSRKIPTRKIPPLSFASRSFDDPAFLPCPFLRSSACYCASSG